MGILDNYTFEELYPQYVQYLEDLGKDTGRPIPPHSFEDFPEWISGLAEHVLKHSIDHWEKGYAQVILEEREEIRAMLEQRKHEDI
ncbi:hypothetical protein AUJ46_03980 [Candidatus Peregrinibacteria bacterium CG1_02_54_53]|nr:MAG: hypothetical protein AUJ46_03980 [Candidatus Peregrinibacteria bacterium CG1_02_54_53]